MIAASYFEKIEAAKAPSDLFPDADAARSQYRRLARIVHPDKNPDDIHRAEAAFARLSELWTMYSGGHTATSSDSFFTTKRHTFSIQKLYDRGDIANIYHATYDGDNAAAVKIVRNPKHNDFIANEIEALKTLNDVPDKYRNYHLRTIDSFRHRDVSTGKDRRAVVVTWLDGFVSLADIIAAYPAGINARDMAWIARRLFIALDLAHTLDLAHGAVFPEHVMVHPTDHGLVLVDWTHSRSFNEKLTTAVSSYYKDGWYGTAFDKPLDHRLDINQASRTLEALLGEQGARPFRAFFRGCRLASTPIAGQLLEEFDSLLFELWGPRRYRPFEMPQGWRKDPNG